MGTDGKQSFTIAVLLFLLVTGWTMTIDHRSNHRKPGTKHSRQQPLSKCTIELGRVSRRDRIESKNESHAMKATDDILPVNL